MYKRSEIEFVFTTTDNRALAYSNYCDTYFDPIMEIHQMSYISHCCRHAFISLMTKENINPTIVKHIVGHRRAMSLIESIYTHFANKELVAQVNKIVK